MLRFPSGPRFTLLLLARLRQGFGGQGVTASIAKPSFPKNAHPYESIRVFVVISFPNSMTGNLFNVIRFFLLFFALFSFARVPVKGQVALVPGVQVNRLMEIKPNAVRVVYDHYSAAWYYSTSEGNIYRIDRNGSQYTEHLVYTTQDHGVEYMMGFLVRGLYIYVSGNNGRTTPYTTGLVVRGTRNGDGSCVWNTVVRTAPYETAGNYDHMMGGLVLSPCGDSLLFSNGSRGDHGEVNTLNGQFPGLRNTPLTTHVFCVPSNGNNIELPYDSVFLAQGPYLYASGVRNFFDMAYSPEGELFALENSGDRDHNEEMNWLRQGRHYGFPWFMGETFNPLQIPGYDITQDKLLPQNSYGKSLGLFYSDSSFPPPPPGLLFTEPVLNMGPDADKFKDTVTGAIYDASDMGIGVRTFTAHRSPLGLVFDHRGALAAPYTGDGFMLSHTKGIDSSEAFFPNNMAGPFLDSSEDLVHLKLEKDQLNDNYIVRTTRIVGGFSGPVDADILGNTIYIIENKWPGGTPAPGLYEVTLPAAQGNDRLPVLFPNPAGASCYLRMVPEGGDLHAIVYTVQGRKIIEAVVPVIPGMLQDVLLNTSGLSSGTYYCTVLNGGKRYNLVFQKL